MRGSSSTGLHGPLAADSRRIARLNPSYAESLKRGERSPKLPRVDLYMVRNCTCACGHCRRTASRLAPSVFSKAESQRACASEELANSRHVPSRHVPFAAFWPVSPLGGLGCRGAGAMYVAFADGRVSGISSVMSV